MQHTPRYPLGTRVSKYFPGYKEPFAGVVDDFSTYSHFYHITYEDGDSEEMTEEDLHVHVLHVAPAPSARPRSPPEPPVKNKKPKFLNLNDKAPGASTSSRSNPISATSSPTASSPRSAQPRPQKQQHQPPPAINNTINRSAAATNQQSGARQPAVSQEEMNKLLGVGIAKLFVGDDGREIIVNGTVSSYFIATRKYRVLFYNGVCEDLSYQDVIESIPLSSPSDEESKKRKLADGVTGAAVPSTSPKKRKVIGSNNDGTAAAEPATKEKKKSKESDRKGDSDSMVELSPPFDSTQGIVKTFAHNITRNVLYVVVSTSPEASGDGRKELQLAVLANADLKVGIRSNLLLYGCDVGEEPAEGGRPVVSVNSVLTLFLYVALVSVWASVFDSAEESARTVYRRRWVGDIGRTPGEMVGVH